MNEERDSRSERKVSGAARMVDPGCGHAVEFEVDPDGRALTIVIDSRSPVTRWTPTEAGAWLGTDAAGRLTALTAYGDTPDAARLALAAALEGCSSDLMAVLAGIMRPHAAVRTRR
jgi:hypothetical protein